MGGTVKKFLVLAIILLPLTAFAEEGERVPLVNMCRMSTADVHEARYCKIWNNTLDKSEMFRPITEEETHILYQIMLKYDEQSDMLAVSATVLFSTPSLNGFTAIIWQRISLIRNSEYQDDADENLKYSMGAVVQWLPGAVSAIGSLCPDCTGDFKSVAEQ